MSDLAVGVIIIVGLALVVMLSLVPGWIAEGRGHPSVSAIRLCGLIGAVFWPAWVVAIVWAYSGEDRRAGKSLPTARPRDPTLMAAPMPGVIRTTMPDPANDPDAPGLFDVRGVDKLDGSDARLAIRADSLANAKAKAELKGLIVTKIERTLLEK